MFAACDFEIKPADCENESKVSGENDDGDDDDDDMVVIVMMIMLMLMFNVDCVDQLKYDFFLIVALINILPFEQKPVSIILVCSSILFFSLQ